MYTYHFKTAGLTCFFALEEEVYDTGRAFPDELKMQVTSIEGYTKQFNWIKQMVSSDKLIFAAVGSDGKFENINNHVFEYGMFYSVLNTLPDSKQYMFVYERTPHPVFLREFLKRKPKFEIRLIYEKGIMHRYVSHYINLFEKQFREGDLISGDNFYMVLPDTSPHTENFTKVVDVNA